MAKKLNKKVQKTIIKQDKILKKLNKIKEKIKNSISYATHGKQSNKPINTSDIILNNVKDMVKSTTPTFLSNNYDQLMEKIFTRVDPLENKWNYFWTAKKDQDRYILRNILFSAEDNASKEEVAQRIENSAIDLVSLADRIIHESDDETLQQDFEIFTNVLLGRPMTSAESRKFQQNLEKMQSQTLENYLSDEIGEQNPITGSVINKYK